jgi:hypothetical protein
MRHSRFHRSAAARGSEAGRWLAALLLAVPLAACNDVLSVETPSRLPAAELDKPENATLLVKSSEADFQSPRCS